MPKVYATNIGTHGHDLSRAEAFGSLVPVLCGPVNIFYPDVPREAIRKALIAFNPKEDYLLVTGASVTYGWALMALRTMLGDSALIQTLLWDSKTQTYITRTIGVR